MIFLNDFRWSDKIIPWHDLLLLLEGQTVHLPATKSLFERDVPIFCTGKDELVYIRGGVADSRETDDILPCPRCFAEFICGREGSVAAN